MRTFALLLMTGASLKEDESDERELIEAGFGEFKAGEIVGSDDETALDEENKGTVAVAGGGKDGWFFSRFFRFSADASGDSVDGEGCFMVEDVMPGAVCDTPCMEEEGVWGSLDGTFEVDGAGAIGRFRFHARELEERLEGGSPRGWTGLAMDGSLVKGGTYELIDGNDDAVVVINVFAEETSVVVSISSNIIVVHSMN